MSCFCRRIPTCILSPCLISLIACDPSYQFLHKRSCLRHLWMTLNITNFEIIKTIVCLVRHVPTGKRIRTFTFFKTIVSAEALCTIDISLRALVSPAELFCTLSFMLCTGECRSVPYTLPVDSLFPVEPVLPPTATKKYVRFPNLPGLFLFLICNFDLLGW